MAGFIFQLSAHSFQLLRAGEALFGRTDAFDEMD